MTKRLTRLDILQEYGHLVTFIDCKDATRFSTFHSKGGAL